MAEEKDEKVEGVEEVAKKKEDEALPFCTTAPSAEHAKAGEDDEACDDFREGK